MSSNVESPRDPTPGETVLENSHARAAHPLPESIGPYRIIEIIGEGGMGVVYKAEQRGPVRRVVALKVIKMGMDTKEVIARFDAERQALALMSHPNVAKVYEAGMTEQGRPYFAMEYVPGVSVTAYCDTQKLTTRERIELFIPVCQAVQHAHQKGVIHRDLKPGNILITLFDGKPVPKVIDFGVAKATSIQLTAKTLFTQAGTVIGTLEYMSPEQATGSGLDVDTRTDVYSLGVILYQLLTGSLPFEPESLRKASMEMVAHIIQNTDPPKPSLRLTVSRRTSDGRPKAPAADEIARRHGAELHELRRELKGDLDWIVLKAMEKDRTRRYETATALADDLRRHLSDEVVWARSPGMANRVRKFARRHRAAVLAAAVILSGLLIGLATATTGFIRASRDRNLAVIAKEDAEHQKRIAVEQRSIAQQKESEALAAADRANRVSGFVQEVLASLSSEAVEGFAPTQSLDEVARRLEKGELAADPIAEAGVRISLAQRYCNRGFYHQAMPHFQWAVDLNRSEPRPMSGAALAECLNQFAEALVTDGDFGRAEPLVNQSLALLDQSKADLSVALALDLRGSILASRGDWSGAGPLFKRSFEIRNEVPGTTADLAESLCHRGDVLLHEHHPEGQADIRKALETYQALYAGRPTALIGPFRRFARSAAQRGDFESANDILQKVVGETVTDPKLLRELIAVESELLRTRAHDINLLEQRAEYLARVGEFERAAADFGNALGAETRVADRVRVWHESLPLLLQVNEVDQYRRGRRAALREFASSTDGNVLHRIAKSSLCCPIEGEDLDLAVKMADAALLRDSANKFYLQSKGMAEYRAGHYGAAISALSASNDHTYAYRDILGEFYIAMAAASAGDGALARAAYDRGVALWKTDAPKAGSDDLLYFQDWAACNLAFHEAQGLIAAVEPAAATQAKSGQRS